ncbi:ABC-type transport system permease protein (probable substrate dipeptide/oligopeptide) (plasmid) [Natrialba magadii ATCC 43099]|uniref:ABC-type transport system permease protein (Probable substrate dipeptide/oligopeptide) n=1 Tax=Natrialba magadii (strain ATCC 43099 / DSM 3394 / CCM 3739 / CIP 104546 / IAM 13178 / JCM 8861 / NBRC 102185 / NCIMB 2190 / MS3) TaxID=547559 RepID=D3T1R9_NATMM|nr:ABC transporter permease [Natrialba magadii]ADD07528.1 ABC-type transport system permease protein (probable substrate dipeptide/oligopeptide) [Natrialba magadii ATCC 43099]ELY26564.1 binding-protein-dependent transport system inner membrane protein [Natrialba magadii ATCC 43099]
MSKVNYALRRTGQLVLTIWAIATMLFAMFRMMPGDPTVFLVDEQMDPDQRQALIEQYGLDAPLHEQYIEFMIQIVTLDLGLSFHSRRPVRDVIAIYLPNTLILMLTALVLAYIFGVTFGVIAAWARGSGREKLLVVLALVQRSFPSFWVGLVVLWIFGAYMDVIPMSGMTSREHRPESFFMMITSIDFLWHLIAPASVLAFYSMGYPLLLMRNNMLEVLTEDFIDVCRAKGLSERKVMFKHAARNALLPVVTAGAVAVGYAVGGSVLIETVFGWPGIGREMVNAVLRRDYPVAQGTFILLASTVVFMNFFADLLYSWLDPRVTYD